MRDPDSDSRRGNPVLLVVLIIVSLVVTTAYFRESDDGPLHSARRGALAMTQPFARVGEGVAAPFRAFGRFVDDIGTSRDEIATLERQNEELRARLAELEEARLENERLRELVEFAQQPDALASVGARVIGRPTTSWDASILLDKGELDGIREGLPVVASQGLVGQVVETSKHTSKVRLLTDRRSGVAVIIQSSRALGIAQGSLTQVLEVDYIPADQSPQVGDVVLSSGLGGVYPKGLVVGDVTEVTSPRGSLYPRVVVKTRVPIYRIEEVLVLVEPAPEADLGVGE